MPDAFVLSDQDRILLQRWLEWARRQPVPPLKRGGADALEPGAPEIYVALTPAGGIPALTVGTAGAPDEPGAADCEIYRVRDLPDGPELHAVGALSRTVYNLTGAVVPGTTWVLIARDKAGSWFAVRGGGGGLTGTRTVHKYACAGSPAVLTEYDAIVEITNGSITAWPTTYT